MKKKIWKNNQFSNIKIFPNFFFNFIYYNMAKSRYWGTGFKTHAFLKPDNFLIWSAIFLGHVLKKKIWKNNQFSNIKNFPNFFFENFPFPNFIFPILSIYPVIFSWFWKKHYFWTDFVFFYFATFFEIKFWLKIQIF